MAYLGADGRWRHRGGSSHERAHARYGRTREFTQVQGPREEVKPLLLLVCLGIISVGYGYNSAP